MGVSGCEARLPPRLGSPGFTMALAFLLDEVSKIARNVLCHDARRAGKSTVTLMSHAANTVDT